MKRRENKATNIIVSLVSLILTLWVLPFPTLSIYFSFICGFFVCKILEDINEDIDEEK